MKSAMAIVLFAAFLGCLTPKERFSQREIEVTAPFDQVWSMVIEFLAEENMPIKVIEKASGLVTTDPMDISTDISRSELAECGAIGTSPFWDRERKRVVFSIFVAPGSSSIIRIRVHTRAEILAKSSFFGSWAWHPCESTGHIEKKLLDTLEARTTTVILLDHE